jgi:NAD+ diphosphatase
VQIARLEHMPLTPVYTGMAFDRASTDRKDAAWLERQFAAEASRAVLVDHDGIVIDGEAVARAPLVRPWPERGDPILLGLEGGRAVFALDLDALSPEAAAELRRDRPVVGLRDAGAELTHAEGGLAAYAVALVTWHRRHGFCANCGAATSVTEGGYVRHCGNCGRDHFPRTDPVVIMLVEHDGSLLLGRRTGWPPRRYSALAGFVSPGESAEEAVIREVHEESGVTAIEPRFVASQPWPFPSSLMLGFEASSPGGRPAARDGELEDVRWFTCEEVLSAAAGTNPDLLLPPRISIARFLIDGWVARHGGRDPMAR